MKQVQFDGSGGRDLPVHDHGRIDSARPAAWGFAPPANRNPASCSQTSAPARSGRPGRAELSGSTITRPSLRPMGGLAITPIVNQPEVAIIGVNKMIEPVVARDRQRVIRTMMKLSSSFDHRVVDGWEAAAFVQSVKPLIENPATSVIDQAWPRDPRRVARPVFLRPSSAGRR